MQVFFSPGRPGRRLPNTSPTRERGIFAEPWLGRRLRKAKSPGLRGGLVCGGAGAAGGYVPRRARSHGSRGGLVRGRAARRVSVFSGERPSRGQRASQPGPYSTSEKKS